MADSSGTEGRFEQLKQVLTDSPLLVNGFDRQGRCTLWNPACERLFGWRFEELASHPDPLALFYPDEDVRQAVKNGFLAPAGSGFQEWAPLTRQGKVQPCLWANIMLPNGELICIGHDISEQKQAETQLQMAARVFECSTEGILITDADNRIIRVNPAVTLITGYNTEELLGQTPALLASGRHDADFFEAMWHRLATEDHWRGEIWNRRKNGEIYPQWLAISALRDRQGRISHYVAVFSDISQLKADTAELEHIAQYDPLTGVPNRRLLADRLLQAMARARRLGSQLAVCYLDLDGFKQVNDRHGHPAGDQLLIEISRRLTHILRQYDTLARLGGDEFVLLFAELQHSEDIAPILSRVLAAVAAPVELDDARVQVSASIGVTFYPHDDGSADLLLQHADQAMYHAKQGGRNRYRFYDPGQQAEQQSRQHQLKALEQALQRREFVLYYQPKVDLLNGRVIGLEALIRWQHPQLGLLVPAAFLHQLAGSRLEWALGQWVLDSVLHQLADWQEQGLALGVSLNISADHLLQPDFVGQLEASLGRHPQVPAGHLELEFQEIAVIRQREQLTRVLEQCHRLGVQVALDNFGTGLSALSSLRTLPLDRVNIDHSFVSDMLSNTEDLELVSSMLQLARTFHHPVVAEGVESPELGALLLRLGCHFAQGYGIAEPMPAEQVPAWIRRWHEQALWSDLRSRPDAG
ncbi:PAS domain S-box protein [Zobellella denitrificans]|jgi:diguanylate cyclase (GGDEF)-like protein/PAS domain S-box-containing protein|uniref:sensor domain-containing protein n=1 Tax=Zobellella denitrificans TaxID=347534 RepID=UPI000B8C4B53|nr:EAL domain-containing protein [Zobellella denitrificans]OXS14124.1 PAS domain S-box protein [Zobellella denitrificans]